MKRLTIFLLLAATACSTSPISYLVATPQPADAAYSCAVRKINELGYTVVNTNAGAGFVMAEKQSSGLAKALFSGQTTRDQLTVSIFGDSASGRKIRVTAAGTTESTNLITTSKTGTHSPSDKAIGDANDVLLACGTGPVSKQASSAQYDATAPANGLR